jgi:hypothetical protein
MICLAEKKSPVAITRDYHIVQGRLSKKALAALAEFRAKGGKHKWLSSGDAGAARPEDHYAEVQLTDRDGNSLTYRYSMADANAEGLVKKDSRWTKRPGNMLRARCLSNGLGMLCPEIFAGDDSGDDEIPAESKMDLGKSEPQPANAQPASNVIDIQATKVEPKREEAAGAAQSTVTVEPEKAEAKEFQPGPGYAATAQTLPDELARKVEEAIGAQNLDKAFAWMVKEGWLTAEQHIIHLPEARAKRILKQTAGFLKAIGATPA